MPKRILKYPVALYIQYILGKVMTLVFMEDQSLDRNCRGGFIRMEVDISVSIVNWRRGCRGL